MARLNTYVFPVRALQTQRRYLRWFSRQSKDMKVRQYVARVLEINKILQQFPLQAGENANLSQKLPSDEILDLSEFDMPSFWQKTIVVQGFDPLEHIIQELVNFCERL